MNPWDAWQYPLVAAALSLFVCGIAAGALAPHVRRWKNERRRIKARIEAHERAMPPWGWIPYSLRDKK
jgi:uncharacterized integral membrane protein